jgi:hypothetical protein
MASGPSQETGGMPIKDAGHPSLRFVIVVRSGQDYLRRRRRQLLKANDPRDAVAAGAVNPQPVTTATPPKKQTPGGGKSKPRQPSAPKLVTKLPSLPQAVSKPKVPGMLKPLGGGTGEPDPQLTPRNSQRGVKQRISLDVPGVKVR